MSDRNLSTIIDAAKQNGVTPETAAAATTFRDAAAKALADIRAEQPPTMPTAAADIAGYITAKVAYHNAREDRIATAAAVLDAAEAELTQIWASAAREWVRSSAPADLTVQAVTDLYAALDTLGPATNPANAAAGGLFEDWQKAQAAVDTLASLANLRTAMRFTVGVAPRMPSDAFEKYSRMFVLTERDGCSVIRNVSSDHGGLWTLGALAELRARGIVVRWSTIDEQQAMASALYSAAAPMGGAA